MLDKLIITFFKRLEKDKSVIIKDFLNEKISTPGQLLDFLNEMINLGFIEIKEGKAFLVTGKEKIAKYKKDKFVKLISFSEADLQKYSKKFDETFVLVLEFIAENHFVSFQELTAKGTGILANSAHFAIDFLLKAKFIQEIEGEFFCVLNEESYKRLHEILRENNLDVNEIKRKVCNVENFPCLFKFKDFECSAMVNKAHNPIEALFATYTNCQDNSIKSFMRFVGLQYFAYATVVDTDNSKLYLLNGENCSIALDFKIAFDKQIMRYIEQATGNSPVVLKVEIVLKKGN